MSVDDLIAMEQAACPTCGSCSGMFTANSMNTIMEMLGVALPGNGTLVATSKERHELIYKAAFHLMDLVKKMILSLVILLQRKTIDDAFALDMAMGGSTNTVLHLLAIANEAGIDYDLNRINEVAKTRTILGKKISPASDYSMHDVHLAGGVSAIIKELASIPGAINSERITITGKIIV
ncbi:hypothetical protein GCM10020331_069350 [Ectobacillus funiculus]